MLATGLSDRPPPWEGQANPKEIKLTKGRWLSNKTMGGGGSRSWHTRTPHDTQTPDPTLNTIPHVAIRFESLHTFLLPLGSRSKRAGQPCARAIVMLPHPCAEDICNKIPDPI